MFHKRMRVIYIYIYIYTGQTNVSLRYKAEIVYMIYYVFSTSETLIAMSKKIKCLRPILCLSLPVCLFIFNLSELYLPSKFFCYVKLLVLLIFSI